MIRPLALPVLISMALAGCGDTAPADGPALANESAAAENVAAPARPPAPRAEVVRVRLETEAGEIVLALDGKRAPLTTANFLAYVDQGRFDGTSFYRASPTRGAGAGRGFIQGGIHRNYRLMLPPVPHEPTSRTGLRHEAGTISMARNEPGSATGEFFITASAMPAMDAQAGDPGYAAFGRVVEGMDVVKRILAAPTVEGAGRGAMRGQMIEKPVRIGQAARVE
jgi:peptidyl-prolyl cis-trans isomerase A (cyclophilin A)